MINRAFQCYATTIILIASFLLFGFKNKSNEVKLPKPLKNNFVFIPQSDVRDEHSNLPQNGFYMSTTEVSNISYLEFLNWLKSTGDVETFKASQIDTSNWSTELKSDSSISPYSIYYHKHEAYRNYPVVNISIEGAQAYCRWLSHILNEKNILPEYTIEVRLPTLQEWQYSAQSNHQNSIYSWGGPYLRNVKGQILCNFKQTGDERISYNQKTGVYKIEKHVAGIGIAGQMNDNADVTAPTLSYFPSDFGLYNMNGNVAELVSDGLACGGGWSSTGYDVRNLSTINYVKPSCSIGFRPVMVLHKK